SGSPTPESGAIGRLLSSAGGAPLRSVLPASLSSAPPWPTLRSHGANRWLHHRHRSRPHHSKRSLLGHRQMLSLSCWASRLTTWLGVCTTSRASSRSPLP